MNCVMAPVCTYGTDGTCGCATDLVCRPGHFCNATSDYGPGGAWSALEFDQGSGPCPPNMDCTSSYRLTPDGKLDMSKFGTKSSATVPDATLQSIVAIVDGLDLRRFMRDGFTCDPPPTDVGWSIKLEIPSGALVQDVTGCVITGPNGNLAKQLFGYLTAQ